MSLIVDVATEVEAELLAAELGEGISVERSYRPDFALSDLATTRVTICPKATEIEPLGRGSLKNEIQIDVAIIKHINNESELDGLMDLVERIAAVFRGKRLGCGAAWSGTKNEPIFDQEYLKSKRTFISLLTLTFRIGS